MLRVAYLTDGAQLISAAGDGLLKLWTVATYDCVLVLLFLVLIFVSVPCIKVIFEYFGFFGSWIY